MSKDFQVPGPRNGPRVTVGWCPSFRHGPPAPDHSTRFLPSLFVNPPIQPRLRCLLRGNIHLGNRVPVLSIKRRVSPESPYIFLFALYNVEVWIAVSTRFLLSAYVEKALHTL